MGVGNVGKGVRRRSKRFKVKWGEGQKSREKWGGALPSAFLLRVV